MQIVGKDGETANYYLDDDWIISGFVKFTGQDDFFEEYVDMVD